MRTFGFRSVILGDFKSNKPQYKKGVHSSVKVLCSRYNYTLNHFILRHIALIYNKRINFKLNSNQKNN